MCEKVPFESNSYSELRRSVLRPSLALLRLDVPVETPEMLQCLWDADRTKRKNPFECFAVFQHALAILQSNDFDIFISHAWVHQHLLLCHVYHFVCSTGFKAWYDIHEGSYDGEHACLAGILHSQLVLVCLTTEYQKRPECLRQLRWALSENKPVVVLLMQNDYNSWITPEVKALCKLTSNMYVDISMILEMDWKDEKNLELKIECLRGKLEDLVKVLSEHNCQPCLQ
jgi:hypothetical protein